MRFIQHKSYWQGTQDQALIPEIELNDDAHLSTKELKLSDIYWLGRIIEVGRETASSLYYKIPITSTQLICNSILSFFSNHTN